LSKRDLLSSKRDRAQRLQESRGRGSVTGKRKHAKDKELCWVLCVFCSVDSVACC
jgi:hypothetical protein